MLRPALLACVLVGVVSPAVAGATLVYDRDPLHPSVWVAADDGSGARRLADGEGPRISPDGATVVFTRQGGAGGYRRDLFAVPADGSAAPRVLARGWRDAYTFAWSADSRTIATVVGPEIGRKDLVFIDVATGSRRTVSSGYFSGVTFSPVGDQILFGRTPTDRAQTPTDIWNAAVAGGPPAVVTRDHRSQEPLWGPAGRVVFVRLVDAKARRYGPKSELYVMAPDGTRIRRLTRTKVAQLLRGLSPTAWSADGHRLLAEFGGQDTSYAETVDPVSGAHRPVVGVREGGFIGADLSADGSTILGATGGLDPSSPHDVATIPYGGGALRVLARNAAHPDWNR